MNNSSQCCKNFVVKSGTWAEGSKIKDAEIAQRIAQDCLVTVKCDNCDLCIMFCPDLCITRNNESGNIEVDYDYCKGCGICAYICPKNVISMEQEQ